MVAEHKRYTRIRGMSEVRRLPRLGKIRLGVKKKTQAGKEYPAEVPYFVCPPEVEAVYGKTPTAIDIMFPVEDDQFFFQQSYKWYSASHLKCRGDGETAMRRAGDLTPDQKAEMNGELPKDENALVEIACPCPLLEDGKCKQMGNLMVLIPKVSLAGVYQIDTGSFHNIVNLNSAIDYTRSLVGRIALVPMVLKRRPQSIEYQGKKAMHYLLSLEYQGTIASINAMRQNAALIMENVKTLTLPPTPEIARLPAPEPAPPTDLPPAPPPADGQGAQEITVAEVQQDGTNFKITTPSRVVYFTEKREIALAAWDAKKTGKPFKAYVGTEDGVLFVTGIAA